MVVTLMRGSLDGASLTSESIVGMMPVVVLPHCQEGDCTSNDVVYALTHRGDSLIYEYFNESPSKVVRDDH